ncbi:hypothetical protein CMQ_2858 [Grosmannia clavigera kw1407]|uniref:Uncharacterized protein n=1 Tax=Grosmannia clavigera (strain kw1407 / UAMH 11150) TaxID=655863 RepID=F0XHT1_GROCL|nr:uncharacterized protein CMQ_2858 [Grosmannia clavigera kw1407]EFX02929.1 hypothetical protein CMQ_2858 [Grosmannia clavigera kw1407]
MARNYKPSHCNTTAQKPANWTDIRPHKYCGALDLGHEGRPNKTQTCAACQEVKAHMAGLVKRNTDMRRQAKMNWTSGTFEG